MPDSSSQHSRHPHLSRLKAALSVTSSLLTAVFIASVLVIVLVTIPLTNLAYSLDPRLAVAPVVVCLLVCYYLFSKERQIQDIIETAQSVGPSFVQSTVRKVVDTSIESAFETFVLFPIGVALLGVILICIGYTSLGTLVIAVSVMALGLLACCSGALRFLASKLLDSYLGPERGSSENTPLLV